MPAEADDLCWRAQRLRVRLRELEEAAAAEQRALSADERAEVSKLEAEASSLDARALRADEQRRRELFGLQQPDEPVEGLA